eukprot:TRINITY_DN55529_c0_g1_i1.p1 TRINITY_DN55529_c0_g1~~TRINITY_DN55529_c0_g1_i1.p1  ORF type:complete len:330 (+),score=49.73 TRINITY_DN55529_c0_g1_i1:29-1018(+)
MAQLVQLSKTAECTIYSHSGAVPHYVVSTPQTRKICNDPLTLGVRYTRSLSVACAATLRGLQALDIPELRALTEKHTAVAHVLRGGLNFGLREALADAFDWNSHSSVFLSAQRQTAEGGDWVIQEHNYRKLSLDKDTFIVLGDVVATGTTLRHAFKAIGEAAKSSNVQITGLLVFTIGGPRAIEVIANAAEDYKQLFPHFGGASLVYFEGIFSMASAAQPLRLAIPDTDLVRTNTPLLAAEFIESQYEAPSYPLERCTIYDAGSRAFAVHEYIEDIVDYWKKVLELAESGVTFSDYLAEHCPSVNAERFGAVSLVAVARAQLEKLQLRH